MLKKIAAWFDQKHVRAAFGGVAVLATLLLGPFALLLLAAGPREPLLFLFGLAGIAGLVGGTTRIWLGPRFFLFGRAARAAYATLIAAGCAAALLAPLALPGRVFWATVAPLVGVAGLLLLAGSVVGAGPGPNNSSKPTPLRGAA